MSMGPVECGAPSPLGVAAPVQAMSVFTSLRPYVSLINSTMHDVGSALKMRVVAQPLTGRAAPRRAPPRTTPHRRVAAAMQVIDCRYPYEFSGGHIAGARNMFSPTQILSLVEGPRPEGRVLVFHCECSLERGPKLSRFLRSSDREKNKEKHPSLQYPAV